MRRSPTGIPAALAAAAAALLLLAGCSSDGGPSGTGGSAASAPPAKGTVDVVRTVATKLRSPWGLAALPGGDLLVGSRDSGKIVRIAARDGRQSELGTVPGVSHTEEGGLLGLALSPGYADDHLLYAYFTTDSDNRIARMRVDERQPEGRRLGAPDTILRGIPKGVIHNGGRIAFGPDRMLYAGTGESGRRALSEDKSSLGGKILRMTPDGRPAPGNPEAGSVICTFGHRNVQGLAWDTDKRLWASEFGQDTWDEINLIEPGHDYGWPVVEGKAGRPGYTDPVEQWRPADASPSGLAYAKGSLWMAGLRGQRLWRIPVAGGKPTGAPQDFLRSRYGRLRSVLATDDGGLWLTTSNTDGRGEPSRDDDRLLLLKVT
ncbi:glucose sorbosone dehydrogenase [Streptomyces sp. NRRL B-1568]|nr:glucose sorbosone dehydrogenase [Streptomyces sp. NRRL B-1568]